MQCVIAIETKEPAMRDIARKLARKADMKIASEAGTPPDDDVMTLAMRDAGWELRDIGDRPGRGFRIDFSHVLRGGSNRSRRQPLARAMGRGARTIIDATAGLGHDAALLAAMGFEVTAIERNAVLAAMLEDAVRRAASDERLTRALGDRLRVVHADAREALAADQFGSVDCVYFDPMFPPKRKASALAKKEIRLVRELVGEDEDAGELLAIARRAAPRVAVKRPHHALPLASGVSATIEANLVRYDVYIRA